MTSTYSNNLKLELMVTGANASTWGDNTNNNLNIVDAYTAGVLQYTVLSTSPNIEATNKSSTSNAAHKVIEFTGTLTGATIATLPAVEGNYLIYNNTTANGHAFSVAPYGHTGNAIELSNGSYSWIYNTSSNVVKNGLGTLGDVTINGDISNVTGNVTITGTTTLTDNVTASANVSLADDSVLNFGAGDDLQIVHDASNSSITSSTGSLHIDSDSLKLRSASGEEYLTGTADGAVDIYYDDAVVFSTIDSGVDVQGKITVENAAVAEAHTLSDGAAITLDLSVGNNFSVTLGGNRTLSNPTNETVGQCGFIIVRQDGTGGRTLAFGSEYKFIGGSGPNLASRTANQVDRLDYVVVSDTEIHVNATGPYS